MHHSTDTDIFGCAVSLSVLHLSDERGRDILREDGRDYKQRRNGVPVLDIHIPQDNTLMDQNQDVRVGRVEIHSQEDTHDEIARNSLSTALVLDLEEILRNYKEHHPSFLLWGDPPEIHRLCHRPLGVRLLDR